MSKIITCALIVIVIFCSCQTAPVMMKDSTFGEFDTISTVTAYNYSTEEFESLKSLVFEELKRYHELFDNFNTYENINNIKTINSNAGIKPVEVDRAIIDIINSAILQHEKTSGYCSIAFGSVTNLWRISGENGSLPSEKELEFANSVANIEDIIIDEKNSTVYLSQEGMSLDLGAVAKGYVADKIAITAIENGFESFMLDLGGNIKAVGNKVEDEPWLIGVSSGEEVVESVELNNKSAVTSSGEIRTWEIGGESYHHIIDKDTLYPAVHHKSVTVIANSSFEADVLSTALFCVSYDEGMEILRDYEDVSVIWTLTDGSIIKS